MNPRLLLLFLPFILFNCDKHAQELEARSAIKDSLIWMPYVDTFEMTLAADVAKAHKYLVRGVAIADSLHVRDHFPRLHSTIGMYYQVIGQSDSALLEFEKCGKIAHIRGRAFFEASAYLNASNIYNNRGDYLKSLEYQHKSLKLLESINNKYGVAVVYGNMGNNYESIKDYTKALEYQEKALALYTEIKDKNGVAKTLGNLGSVYYNQKDTAKCLDYQHKSLAIHREIGNKQAEAVVVANIGMMFREKGQLDSALKYVLFSLEIREKLGDMNGIAFSNNELGIIYLKRNEYSKAEEVFEKARVICENNKNLPMLRNLQFNLYELQKKMGKYKEALSNHEKFLATRDTIINVDKLTEINKREMAYDYEIKEAETRSELEKQKLMKNVSIVGGILVLLILGILFRNFLNKKKANKLLEEKNEEIHKQKELVEEKQKEIVDSINYAQQIQKTLLANHEMVNQTIPDSFVMFQPRDIVSGDFYWATKKNDRFYLAVCDSTGHGVPGAFMSLLNISFLNEAISEKGLLEPNEIFDFVRQRLIDNISQAGRKDGMDGILICIHDGRITYAGANNGPMLVSDGVAAEFPADKMPVGKGEKDDPFTLRTLNVKKGDMLYLYTDGYADQFGGPKGKKFKYKQLDDLLLANWQLPVIDQEKILIAKFADWKGKLEQVDDVCILGIRI